MKGPIMPQPGAIDRVMRRYETCEVREGIHCTREVDGKVVTHDVGINGQSILFHCGRCEVPQSGGLGCRSRT